MPTKRDIAPVTEYTTPVFDKNAVDEKFVRINAMRDRFVQLSHNEITRLGLLDQSAANKSLIATEKNKIQLAFTMAELMTLTETAFIPKMNFLLEVLNSLETVNWLNAAEKETIKLFTLLLEQLIKAANELKLTDIINDNDTSIYTWAESLSKKINSDQFRQYFQTMSLFSAMLSNLTKIEITHKEQFSDFMKEKQTILSKDPYNYITVENGPIDMYTSQPMQMSMRYSLLYADILKFTKNCVTSMFKPQTDEEVRTLNLVEKANKFCVERAILTNEIEREYKKNTTAPTKGPVKGTNYTQIISSIAIGVALGVGLAFGLLALGAFPPLGLGILALALITASFYGVMGGVLGAIIPKIFKKEAPISITKNVQPTQTAASQRKKIDVGSSASIDQYPNETVEPRIKPSKKDKAFFEDRSPTGSGDELSISSGMEPSPKTGTPVDDSENETESINIAPPK